MRIRLLEASHGGTAAADKNTLNGSSTGGAAELRLFQRFTTILAVPGYAGANNNNVAMNSFLIARNNLTNAVTDGTGSVDADHNVGAGGPGYSGVVVAQGVVNLPAEGFDLADAL